MIAALTARRAAFLGGFAQGMALGGIVLLCIAVWLWTVRASTYDRLDAQLAHITVPIMAAAPTSLAPIKTPSTPSQALMSPAPAGAKPVAAPPNPVPTHVATGPLPPAPLAGLVEATPTGNLPRIDPKTGQTPFNAYKRPFTPVAGRPVVSLIVTDLGLSQAASQAAIAQLPPDMSVGISPYAASGAALIGAARARGHEAWLVLPMQTATYPRTDPGPKTLLNGAPAPFNLARLDSLMKTGQGYAGFIGSYDPVFLAAPGDALPIVTTLWQRGLGLADTSQKPMTGVDPAKPYIHVDLWIDRSVNAASLADSLKLLEAVAQRNGHASAVLQPLPLSYPILRQWADGLPSRGFALGPLSAQIQAKP